MSFADETPLEDVLKYVKQATTTNNYSGIPIYVDPIGLQEAEKSMKLDRDYRPQGSSSAPHAASGSQATRPDLLRPGRDDVHHVIGVGRHIIRPVDERTVTCDGQDRQSRTWGMTGKGNERTD